MEEKKSSKTSHIKKSTTGNYHLGRLIMQLRRLERHPQIFGEAGPLTPSEIHTIEAIGYKGGIPMGELASRLGVTKGAVTQVIGRLESKGFVKRSPHPKDSRAVIVALTAKGKSAYKAHDKLQKKFYMELSSQLEKKEIEIFEKCLEKLNEYLQK